MSTSLSKLTVDVERLQARCKHLQEELEKTRHSLSQEREENHLKETKLEARITTLEKTLSLSLKNSVELIEAQRATLNDMHMNTIRRLEEDLVSAVQTRDKALTENTDLLSLCQGQCNTIEALTDQLERYKTVEEKLFAEKERLKSQLEAALEERAKLAKGRKLVPPDLYVLAIVANMNNPNYQNQLEGIESCGRLSDCRIDNIIESGIVPKLVEFLGRSDLPELSCEAASALAEVARQHCRVVVESGAVPILIWLLSSDDMNIVDQALWILGIIAYNDYKCRDLTVHCGIIQPLIALVRPELKEYFPSVRRTLSSMCHNITFDTAQQVVPALAELLHRTDKEVVSYACEEISHMSDWVDSRVVPRLVELLASPECVKSSLHAVRNMFLLSSRLPQIVLDCGVLKHFDQLLRHTSPDVQKKAVETISIIALGEPYCQSVIEAGLMPLLVDIMAEGEYKAQKEAVCGITDIIAYGSIEQVMYIVQAGALIPLCNLLVVKKTKIVTVILDAIANVLTAASKVNQVDQVCRMIEECEGLDKIKALQQHQNDQVCQQALSIIDTFFSEADEDQTVAPSTGTGTFQSPIVLD